MSAAPAYSYGYPQRAPQRNPRPDVRVVPGRRNRAAQQPSTLNFRVVAIALVALLLTAACIGIVRIGLYAATISTSVEAQQLESQIDDARAAGRSLEVTQSSLSNPTRLKAEANRLKLTAAGETTIITLPEDVVATDEAGNLSLSKSAAIASGAGE